MMFARGGSGAGGEGAPVPSRRIASFLCSCELRAEVDLPPCE
jgi:hypothetical protein